MCTKKEEAEAMRHWRLTGKETKLQNREKKSYRGRNRERSWKSNYSCKQRKQGCSLLRGLAASLSRRPGAIVVETEATRICINSPYKLKEPNAYII